MTKTKDTLALSIDNLYFLPHCAIIALSKDNVNVYIDSSFTKFLRNSKPGDTFTSNWVRTKPTGRKKKAPFDIVTVTGLRTETGFEFKLLIENQEEIDCYLSNDELSEYELKNHDASVVIDLGPGSAIEIIHSDAFDEPNKKKKNEIIIYVWQDNEQTHIRIPEDKYQSLIDKMLSTKEHILSYARE